VIANGIEFIDVQLPFIGCFEPFFHLKVEHLKTQPLRFFNLLPVGGDSDFKPRHTTNLA